MAVLKINTLEGGTDGVNVSNANSGGASGDNLTNVTIGDASHSIKYALAAALATLGSMGMRFIAGAVGAQTFLEEAFASQTEIAGTFYFSISSLVTIRPIRVFGTAGQNSGLVGSVQVTSGGVVRWLDCNGAVRGSIALPISAGLGYRLAYHVKPGTIGGANTVVDLSLFAASGGLIGTATSSTAETLSTDITTVRYGFTGTTAASVTLDMDYLRVDSGATLPTGPVIVDGTASIGGTGGATPTVFAERFGSGSAAGVGGLTASASTTVGGGQNRAFETHIKYETAVQWGGTPAGFTTVTGSASIGGTGGVTAAATATRFASATISGLGGLSGSGKGEAFGTAALSGAGGLTASGRAESFGAATIGGVSSMQGTAAPDQSGSAHVGGAGALTASGFVIAEAQASIGGHGSSSGTAGLRDAFAEADLHGSGEIILGDGITAGPPEPPLGTRALWQVRPPAWEILPPDFVDYPAPGIREVAFDELDAEGRTAYLRALRYSRAIRARVQILDPNEQPVVDLSAEDAVVLDGSVQVDAGGETRRRLTLSIADPRRDLVEFDEASAAGAPIGAGGFVHVERLDQVPELGQFVSAPIFRGPVSSFHRVGPDVSLEAMGKEAAMQVPNVLWATMTISRGTNLVDAIRRLAGAMGETRFRLPEVNRRLQSVLSVPRGAAVWPVLQGLARTLGRDLYYDAAGYLTARIPPTVPGWTFTDDPELSNLLSEPDITFDVTAVRNAVQVVGRQPSRGVRPVGLAIAPPEHPLSPQALARGGRPRYIFERIEAEHLSRTVDCKALAEAQLQAFLIAGVQATFSASANPLLEIGDVAAIASSRSGLEAQFRVSSFTLPLVDAAMTIGDVRRMRQGGKVKQQTVRIG